MVVAIGALSVATVVITSRGDDPPPLVEDVALVEDVEAFALAFDTAFVEGDVQFLTERLGRETLELYGADQCRSYLTALVAAERPPLELVRIVGVGPWNYFFDVDGALNIITVADVTTVEVSRVVAGQTAVLETQWKLTDGEYRWFADCGDVQGVG